MVRYNAIDDPLCYPGSQVLRNKPKFERSGPVSANWFCYPEHFKNQAESLFGQLAEEDGLRGLLSKQAFPEQAALFLSEFNAIRLRTFLMPAR